MEWIAQDRIIAIRNSSVKISDRYSRLVYFILLSVSGCTPTEKEANPLPPTEVITSAYQLADAVLFIEVEKFAPADTLFTDDGSPGYDDLRFEGRITAVFKGSITTGSEICVRNQVEYSPELIRHWKELREICVFLTNAEGIDGCRRVLEAGLFAAGDKLGNVLRATKE